MRRLLGALLLAWLWPLTATAHDILLTAATESPGVRAFVHSLEQRRSADQVRFLPVAELPAPGRAEAHLRLMMQAADKLSAELDALVMDRERKPLTEMAYNQYLAEVRAYDQP